ncbi:uncharacterized protein LOC125382067 [Haliotis rufescens]|uniref:uncharacterized protein LOC125382067 n=1 Tax=Haliotis rufescens TaxID=6454 RepID=UPI00201EE0CA|nr:uncharacterized protein LOC125382067 [Haliotis rufescens]
MMSQVNYQLSARDPAVTASPDRMYPVSTLHRIALVSCERILLLMNNTRMLRHTRLSTMDDVLLYLNGMHDDVGLSGDRGDFYRRKLAEELYTTFSVHGVDYTNIDAVVAGAIDLERQTRFILAESGRRRDRAPPVHYDEQVLDILARIADMH